MNTTTNITCTCYPGGFTPDSYEGVKEDCPEHGRKTGVESIDCTDCGIPHIVDYDTHAVSLAFEHDERSTTLDDDGLTFDCIDCGAKVPA
jgi:hypothetical protein